MLVLIYLKNNPNVFMKIVADFNEAFEHIRKSSNHLDEIDRIVFTDFGPSVTPALGGIH